MELASAGWGILALVPNLHNVPTQYGCTLLNPKSFDGRMHLLGGRPDRQRSLANDMSVISMDCNRFTLDAKYGKAFDGQSSEKLDTMRAFGSLCGKLTCCGRITYELKARTAL
jgi:hypothetical protein